MLTSQDAILEGVRLNFLSAVAPNHFQATNMLKYLHLKNVGLAPDVQVEWAERLSLIAGDNGLGKSFLLD